MIRTKSGCVTCRIRKVKCDETKPQCKRCTSTGLKCDGYCGHRLRLPRREPPPSNRNLLKENRGGLEILPAPVYSPLKLFQNEDGTRLFEVFCSNSIPQTNRLVDSTFWSQLVLQLAHEEPAIKHSILSIGALQRDFELKRHDGKSLAVSNYAQAVRDAQELVQRTSVSRDYTKLLVCAILFHCIESALGNHILARTHLQGGLRLLYENGLMDNEFKDMISNTYRRFDFQSMTFWDASAPYEFCAQTESRLMAISLPGQFSTLNHAANILIELIQWMFYVQGFCLGRFRAAPSDPISYAFQLERCRQYLEVWCNRFEEYKARHGSYLTEFRQKCTLLSIYHLLAWIKIRQNFTDPESQWDLHLADFIRLLDLAEGFTTEDSQHFSRGVASLELGIVVPLFETAVRCRDPHQRRRSVAMLRSTLRREGVWDSYGAAAVAEYMIEVEEEGLVNVEKASDVPDPQRIYFVDPAANLSKREVHITLFSQPHLSTSASGDLYYQWNTRQQVVHF